MNVENILVEFGRLHGFGDIKLNAGGVARLEFEGGLAVDIEYRPGKGLYLHAQVAQLQSKPPAPLLKALLQANAPDQNPDGFVFSIEGDDRLLLSHRMDETAVSSEGLARALERFLDMLEGWKNQAASQFAPDAAAPSSAHGCADWHIRA